MSTTAVQRPRRVPVALAAALSVVVVLVAVPGARASTIHACVKPKSGATRIVGAKAKCHQGEQKLSWNTNGPAGAPGAKGAEGKAGAPGANGTNGAVAGFWAASNGFTELPEQKLKTIASKAIPPGSYLIAGKALLQAESAAAGFAEVGCGLLETPGLTPGGENAETLDFADWETFVGQKKTGEFISATTLALEGMTKVAVTSTLSIACENTSTSAGLTLDSPFGQLFAIQVSSIG